jgi:NADPH:quinone reductase-like Zn-dependent oxidoreductase
MARAVKFETYGGIDVLEVVEVEQPVPGPGEVVVRVKATRSIRVRRRFERVSCTPDGR